MKKVILVVYFGKLPNYFDLFLDSCRRNSDFDFIIFTDQDISPRGVNIETIHISLDELNNLVASKLGNQYQVSSPYKLCDFRPAFGRIFEDYITNYAVWGYCDTDMLFGRISKFISDKYFKSYDKLLVNGHLAFYKNSKKVNGYYLLTSPRYISFAEAAKIKEPCFVDEISMPGVMKIKGIDVYENWDFADILPQSFDMRVQEHGVAQNHRNQKFYYENGAVYQEYPKNAKHLIQEYLYIHLQKRYMDYNPSKVDLSRRVYINPNVFTNDRQEVTAVSRLRYRLKYYWKQLKKLGNVNRIRVKMRILVNSKGLR